MSIKTYKHGRFHGKYFRWKNGLIFKVLGPAKEYADSTVEVQCPIKGNTWITNASGLKDEDIITEEEATRRYFKVEKGEAFGWCTCCAWKTGKPNIRLSLNLAEGQMPSNETYILQDSLREFFKGNGEYVPYIHRTETGVEIEFIVRENETTKEQHRQYNEARKKAQHEIGTCDPETCNLCKKESAA